MNGSVEWAEFAMNWRFMDPKYNLLPESDLEKIRPLSVEKSRKCWNDWVSDKFDHLMEVVRHTGNLGHDRAISSDCGWGDKRKEFLLKKQLDEIMGLKGNEPVTFFWGASSAVETEWRIFLEYWSDFCYPSDDSNVIICPSDHRAVIYVEDKIWVVDRKNLLVSTKG